MSVIDLDAYCARIGYAGARTPTLATLRALHARQPAAIPFEAIDVLLGRGIDLAPEVVEAKLVARHRGGYCFEQNGLFKRVLLALGFRVEGLAARVLRGAPPCTRSRPRTHMVLRVMLDDVAWLADVGFGGVGPTAPLRLDTAEPQCTHYETYRLRPYGDWRLLEARLDGRWEPIYEISSEPRRDVDYIPANWYTSTHPDSHFRRNLMVVRTTPSARYTLFTNRLTIRTPGGGMERRALDADAIEQALAETFDLPVEAAWRPVIERAADRR